MHNSKGLLPIVWFYGLSGSGKTTLSMRLYQYFIDKRIYDPVEILDGDEIRAHAPYKLGYTVKDRCLGLNLGINTAYFLRKNGIACIIASTLFKREHRRFVKELLPCVIDVYCSCSLEVCIKRDTKGIYKKNIAKKQPMIVGLDIPFDEPEAPDIKVDTETMSVEQSFFVLLEKLKKFHII